MTDFKIIAIKPLKGCNPDYLKILKVNQIYELYSDYVFIGNEIKYNPSVPNDLFNQGKLNVNVSAIVGKNGSGKSTIIDLLLMAINNISFCMKQVELIETIELEPVEDLYLQFHYVINEKIYGVEILGNSVCFYNYKQDDNRFVFVPESISAISYELIREKNEIDVIPMISHYNLDGFNLSDFFYSMCTNYSHYALNSLEYGDWVSQIFHKNDSYQAPLVVNPFRKKGNVDINSENYLLKSRLLAFLVSGSGEQHRKITKNQTATTSIFKFNNTKVAYAYSIEYYSPYKIVPVSFEELNEYDNLIKKVEDLVSEIYEFNENEKIKGSLYHTDILKYLIRKLISIARTYPRYRGFFCEDDKGFTEREITSEDQKNKRKVSLRIFIKELKEDDSHVTFKLNQAINFLRNQKFKRFNYLINKNQEIRFDFEDLAECVGNDDIINHLPPAIFDFDLELKNNTSLNLECDKYKFSNLSSGEKQRIYSVYSILYHMYNIDSVSSSLRVYSRINLVFEEVELYFHPEMQKGFLYYLLEMLGKQTYKRITDVNICFVTHSPFILSDIPDSNILFLDINEETGFAIPKPRKECPKTYGANIHDLLKNGFFMESGIMGECVTIKIGQIVEFLDPLKDEINNEIFDEISSKRVIDLIAEPLIKNYLIAMWREKFKKPTYDELELRIKELEK